MVGRKIMSLLLPSGAKICQSPRELNPMNSTGTRPGVIASQIRQSRRIFDSGEFMFQLINQDVVREYGRRRYRPWAFTSRSCASACACVICVKERGNGVTRQMRFVVAEPTPALWRFGPIS